MIAMKNSNLLFFLLVFLLVFTSCASHLSIPSKPIGLQVHDKNEINIAGAVNSLQNNTMYSIQTAYSPIKHVSVAGSYLRVLSNKNDDAYSFACVECGHGYFYQGAIGTYYFLEMTQKQPGFKRGFLFDVYGSLGKGKVGSTYRFNQYSSLLNRNNSYISQGHLNFTKTVLQTGVHFKKSEPIEEMKLFKKSRIKETKEFHFNTGFVWKIGRLNYDKALIVGDWESTYYLETVTQKLEENSSFLINEFSYYLSMGVSPFLINFSLNGLKYNPRLPESQWGVGTNLKVELILELNQLIKSTSKHKSTNSGDL